MGKPLRIGITGHTNLTEDAAQLVYEALVEHLQAMGPPGIVGVTCLASGADQLFARAVREVGGVYEVILPAPDYRSKIRQDRRAEFDALLAGASRVVYTGERASGTAAYAKASRMMLCEVERLLAVWDGAAPSEPGGTADVVDHARRTGVSTTVIWPNGARRG